MSVLHPETIAELACSHARLAAFEASVLEELDRHIGCDVAFFCGGDGVGEASLGLDSAVRPVATQRWDEMSVECLEMLAPARRHGGVIVDSDWFGARLGRLTYHDVFMRPHRGRTTLLAFLECRGVLSGELALGRCRGSSPFSEADVATLRRLVPVLSLSRHAYLGGAGKGVCGARLAPLPAQRDAGPGLTAREREVLGYLHLGYTNEQIGVALGSAPRTVRNQLSSAYAKLGVATRAEAVAWSLEQRVLPRR
jgi:DNA-binding CsgD family transcriptional regulator